MLLEYRVQVVGWQKGKGQEHMGMSYDKKNYRNPMIQILKPQMNLDNGEAFEVSETRILLSDILPKKFFGDFLSLGELRGVDKSCMRHRLKEGKSGRNHEGSEAWVRAVGDTEE